MSTTSLPEREKRRPLPHILLVLASLLVPSLLFAIVAWSDRERVLRETELDVRRTVEIFFAHALNVFETQELIAQTVDEHLRAMRWDEIAASASLHDYLRQLAARYPQVLGIWLVDASGTPRNSSRAFPVPSVNFADRDYFGALRAKDLGTVIGQATTGRVFAEPNFSFARRRGSATGSFDGVIVVSVSPSYLAAFWRNTAPPLDIAAGLVRGDRKILAREPAAPMDELPPSAGMARALREGEQGSFRAISAADGIERMMAFRRVAPYDAYVVYGIGVNAALGRWRHDLVVYGRFFGPAALALSVMALLALRGAQREAVAVSQEREAAHRIVEEAERRSAAEEQLRQTQKMEALGQVTGGIAHDFNNLLTAILGNLESLRGRLGSERDERKLRAALEAAERGERAIQSLLAFARREPLRIEVIDLDDVLQRAESLLRHAIGSKIRLVLALAVDTWCVEADANELELALLNLAVNARAAMPAGGCLRIATANRRLEGQPNGLAGEFVELSVADTGTGMPPDVLARVFEPFFTTKEQGRGTGLGLSQVYRFAAQRGGTVTASSTVGHGTTITLFLPRVSQECDRARVELRGSRLELAPLAPTSRRGTRPRPGSALRSGSSSSRA